MSEMSEEQKEKISQKMSGENHPQSKLDAETVEEMRRLYEEEEWTQQELADEYDVTQPHACLIVNYKIWNKE